MGAAGHPKLAHVRLDNLNNNIGCCCGQLSRKLTASHLSYPRRYHATFSLHAIHAPHFRQGLAHVTCACRDIRTAKQTELFRKARAPRWHSTMHHTSEKQCYPFHVARPTSRAFSAMGSSCEAGLVHGLLLKLRTRSLRHVHMREEVGDFNSCRINDHTRADERIS
jgi:hypothetical protein